MDGTWFTVPVAVALAFVAVSTIAQIAGFGGLLLWQRSNFERRISALEVKHAAERKADKVQFRRENEELRATVRALTSIVREIRPDAEIPLTSSFDAIEVEAAKSVRTFLRRHFSAEEFAVLITDFGLNPDEFQNDTVIARMDRFVRVLSRKGQLDELRDRLIKDRPQAAMVEVI